MIEEWSTTIYIDITHKVTASTCVSLTLDIELPKIFDEKDDPILGMFHRFEYHFHQNITIYIKNYIKWNTNKEHIL